MVLHFAAMTIGARIKQARERIGMSQTRLAELLGVTRSACSQWESAGGTSPKRDRLEEIARLLGVNYEWLATGGGPIQRGERWSVREGDSTQRLALAADHLEILEIYDRLSPERRHTLVAFLRTLQ